MTLERQLSTSSPRSISYEKQLKSVREADSRGFLVGVEFDTRHRWLNHDNKILFCLYGGRISMTSVGTRQMANRTSVTTIVIIVSVGYASLKSRKDEKMSPLGRDRRATSWILDSTFAQAQEHKCTRSYDMVNRARMARGQRASHAFCTQS